MLMPYGKYKGADMEDVPASYLLWIYENTRPSPAVENYIEKNLAGIKRQIADGNGEP
jgi:uncharacterized protein (DUF3820 family)